MAANKLFSMEVEGSDECCELIKYVNKAAEEGSKRFLTVQKFLGIFSKQLMQKEVKFTVKPWEDHNLAIFLFFFIHYITHLNNTPISQ